MAEIKDQPREYYVEAAGRELPRTSTIKDLLAKFALIPWAASCAAQKLKDSFIDPVMSGELFDFENVDIKQLMKDAKSEHRKQSKEALLIGGDEHSAIEHYFLDGVVPKFKRGSPQLTCWKGFQLFIKEHKVKAEFIEERVWSEAGGGYTTQPDFVGLVDDIYTLFDIKTSGAFYVPDHPLQLASQRKALVDTLFQGDEAVIVRMAILRLDKSKAKYEFREFENYYGWLNAWIKLTELYYALQAVK